MKRTRHTPEQVIRKLRNGEGMLAEGRELDEVCRTLEISVQTYHRWAKQYQGVRRQEIVELKNLRKPATSTQPGGPFSVCFSPRGVRPPLPEFAPRI